VTLSAERAVRTPAAIGSCQDVLVSTRTLVILRHAKAANPEGVADRDRPLTPRGHADSAAAGAWLDHSGLVPDLVLCSPARRTRETWHGVALGLSSAPEVHYADALYGGSVRTLMAAVRETADDVSTVLLIGHNPALSDLSAAFDPEHADPDGLRTAGVAVHRWTGNWVDCGPGSAPLSKTHTARDKA
jgi:phosphohistidine phosphatase